MHLHANFMSFFAHRVVFFFGLVLNGLVLLILWLLPRKSAEEAAAAPATFAEVRLQYIVF